MAHKKGVGSSKNGRESHSKRLGLKLFGGQMAMSVREELFTIPVRMSEWARTILFMPLWTVW